MNDRTNGARHVEVNSVPISEPPFSTRSRLGRMVGIVIGRFQPPHFRSSEVGDGFDDFTPEGKMFARVMLPTLLHVRLEIHESGVMSPSDMPTPIDE